jgi:hypothetical protein
MVRGSRLGHAPPLKDVRAHCRSELASLPLALRTLEINRNSPVEVSARQHQLTVECDRIAH